MVKLPDGANPQQLWSPRRASEITGINHWTLRSWAKDKGTGLRIYRIQGRVYFQAEELLRWLDAHARMA